MESVYLETTFISYLVARPSRDVVVAGHQQTTQDWWANRRTVFECFVSQVVIDEASAGDPNEAVAGGECRSHKVDAHTTSGAGDEIHSATQVSVRLC